MGVYREQVLPRVIDKLLDNDDVLEQRRRAAAGLRGVIVEPGFGTGLNLPAYPPEVTRVYAVEPATVGEQLSADRRAQFDVEVEFVGLDGQHLPLDDNSCDGGLLTFTLCTIPNAMQALWELRRVIRPGGSLHWLEHGLAPDEGVVTWQERIEPVHRRLFDGCHLTRPMDRLIADAGFEIEWAESAYGEGPKIYSHIYIGRARCPG